MLKEQWVEVINNKGENMTDNPPPEEEKPAEEFHEILPEIKEEIELALTPAGGLGTFGLGVHLTTIMHTEERKIK